MNAEHEPDYSQVPESFAADSLAEGSDDEAARYNELVIRRLSQQLLLRVHDGVVCYVRRTGDEFEVALYPTLRQDYPSLYGFLLTLNQQITTATGCGWAFAMLLLAVAGVVGVHELLPNLGNHAFWVYPLVIATCIFLWIVGNSRAERGVFQRYTDDLNRQLAQHGIGSYRLIEWLTDDAQLRPLLQRLKEETRLDELSRDM